ncbi:hypothetical protein SLEP1_g54518 [Rubroshorea leprosula]|uniref:Myb-like domain-containing protein n=1 Tax=Rubroshorea leprosula TaxID=152421 RepID=A0AAV5MDR5_9ROSI|nr:hypothetical protein SLEP1_g54518 [Rubroshorea leprosula]
MEEMELFTGHRKDLPQHVAPFSDSLDLAAVICSPEDPLMLGHRPNLPLQKLRPIRYNGTCSQAVEDPVEYAEVVEFLHDQACHVNGESTTDYLVPPIKAEAAELGDVGGGGGGNGPCFDEENRDLDVQEGLLEELSRSSSDCDENDSLASIKEPANHKRKRKARKVEPFLENLVMTVLERQDEMHKQLIQMLENIEKERIIREEAWRRQEMERMKSDEEARIQEMSRNLTLISIIQNVLGHEIDLPLPSTISTMEDNGGNNVSEDHHVLQGDVESKSWQEAKAQSSGGENHLRKDIVLEFDTNNRRWPDDEVQALIMLRTALDKKFHLTGSKCSMWDEISTGMHDMGYNRSAKKCKEKWENINKYFRKSMGSVRKRFDNGKRCTYFQELNTLYGNDEHASAGNSMNHANNDNDKVVDIGYKDCDDPSDLKADDGS